MARQAPKKALVHKPGYRAVVVGEGLLLGGVKTHKSTWFKTKQEALDWTWAIRRGNAEAGRRIARVTIERRAPDGSKEVHLVAEDDEGTTVHHSTRKTAQMRKTPAQLNREIAEVLGSSSRPRTARESRHHATMKADGPQILKISRGKTFAGQRSITADVQYPDEAPSRVEFVGPSSGGGGPVVMVTRDHQTFVRDPARFGVFGQDWVRRFFEAA